MAGLVAGWHTHRVRTPRARHRGLPEKARFVQTLVNGTGAKETLWKLSTHLHGHVARDNAFSGRETGLQTGVSCVHVQRDVSGTMDIWALPLFGDRKPFPVYRQSFPKVKERSPRTADGSPIRQTRPASPTSTFSHFFAPAGNLGSRRMEDGIRTGGPMAEICLFDATGTITAVPIDMTAASRPGCQRRFFRLVWSASTTCTR